MRKTIIAICTFAVLNGMMLSGADKRIPVIWKSAVRPPYKNFQTYAFGLQQEKDECIFVFQIRNLPDLLQKQHPFLSCYFNTDGNVKTGLFSDQTGWDLQFNLDLKYNILSMMTWRTQKEIREDKNKKKSEMKKDCLESSYTFTPGEFSIHKKDDQLFLTVKKNIFFNKVKFTPGFTFAQLITSSDLEKKQAQSMVEKPQKTSSGSFGKQAFILPDLRLQKLIEQSKEE